LFVAAVIAALESAAAVADDARNSTAPSPAGLAHIEMQPWQVRRAAFQKAVAGVQHADPGAKRDFDAVLTEFETRILSRTPMENVEIMGVFYLPKQGADPALSIIVQNLILGWYDALRYATESGRAEILSNDGFFKKAFVLGGPGVTDKATRFLEESPERTSQWGPKAFHSRRSSAKQITTTDNGQQRMDWSG
jgi:hypothetical protein